MLVEMALKRRHQDQAKCSQMQPSAEELEEKEWTILDNYNDISTDDELFYRADYLLITSTPDSILAPAPEEPTLPLTALEPTPPLTALEPTLLLTTLEPTLAQATAPDPTIAPAPEYLTLAPLTASEPAIAEATVQQPTLAPPPEPTHKPPIRQPCGPKCRRKML
ncbi:hypothetical protein KUCAC02_022697 [Chaenocephalus aceratus]|uniref:Uncharacterized protein n=1 Tax=Chaenocephalus aceratus TaxID=36190 RepID=A0ACB9XNI7_CHAAC|nr:hypothetical protein KUCAC02_022697 [Chaenocephalus aceratus]